MSGLGPERLEIVEADINCGPHYPLGVRVNFSGREANIGSFNGFFVCAFETVNSAGDIASAIARKMGLLPPSSDDIIGIDNVLGEFLNIVIGLTCSDWSEHGLEAEFDPPLNLSKHDQKETLVSAGAYHLTMTTDQHPPVSIFLVFLPSLAADSERQTDVN
jgi:hypothetical protein